MEVPPKTTQENKIKQDGFELFESNPELANSIYEVIGFNNIINESEIKAIKQEAISNGTFMFAPDGNKTNLTERQWLQVRTQSFKKWFGDWENDPKTASKIVDKNGEPLKVYHGSTKKFVEFDLERFGGSDAGNSGKGLYFTPNYNIGWSYSKQNTENVMELFLNIKNPADLSELSWADGMMIGATSVNDAKNIILNQIKEHKENDKENYHPEILESLEKDLLEINEKRFVELNKLYDGKMYGKDAVNAGEILALLPNQVKSATDNSGIFSSKNNDIRDSFHPNQQQKQRLQQLYSQYINETGRQDAEGFKNFIEGHQELLF